MQSPGFFLSSPLNRSSRPDSMARKTAPFAYCTFTPRSHPFENFPFSLSGTSPFPPPPGDTTKEDPSLTPQFLSLPLQKGPVHLLIQFSRRCLSTQYFLSPPLSCDFQRPSDVQSLTFCTIRRTKLGPPRSSFLPSPPPPFYVPQT